LTEIQGVLFGAPDISPIRLTVDPWAKACGDVGPFDLLHYTPHGRPRYRVLTCNRADGHGGNHAWTTTDGQTGRTWDRTGRPADPIRPLTGSTDGS